MECINNINSANNGDDCAMLVVVVMNDKTMAMPGARRRNGDAMSMLCCVRERPARVRPDSDVDGDGGGAGDGGGYDDMINGDGGGAMRWAM